MRLGLPVAYEPYKATCRRPVYWVLDWAAETFENMAFVERTLGLVREIWIVGGWLAGKVEKIIDTVFTKAAAASRRARRRVRRSPSSSSRWRRRVTSARSARCATSTRAGRGRGSAVLAAVRAEFDAGMSARGFTTLELETKDGAKSNAYLEDGVMVTLAISKDRNGDTLVSLGSMGADDRRATR